MTSDPRPIPRSASRRAANRARKIEGVAAALVAIAALWQIATLLFVFASRMAYPMDLEWMEGGALYHAHRLMLGQAIYAAPSEGFLPYPYPPLHFAVLALVGALVGLDYWSGRAISIGLVIGAACSLARCAARHAGGTRLDAAMFALIALGAVAAGFPGTGGWYDLARKDALAAALPIFAAGVAAGGRLTRARVVSLALLLTGAVYAKQTGLFFLPVVGLYVLARDRARGLALAAATALAGGAALLALQVATSGWFLHWALLMGEHPISPQRLLPAARALFELAPYLPAAALLAAWLAHRRALSREALLWIGMLGAALLAGLLPHLKPYVALNHSLPIALLAGPVALVVLGEAIAASAAGSPLARWGRTLVYVAAALLLWGGRWQPADYVPDDEQWQRARGFERFAAELPGDLFVPNHPWLAVRTGSHAPQIHTQMYLDTWLAGAPGKGLDAMLEASSARWAVLDGREGAVAARVHQHFGSERPLPPALQPRTLAGFDSRPRLLLERKRGAPRLDARLLFDFAADTGLEGWTLAGEAFEAGPVAPQRASRRGVEGARGARVLSSFHPRLGGAARGRALSPAFAIDRDRLAVSVAGGARGSTRVELLVAGEPVRRASGGGGSELIEVVWDVSELRRRRGQLRLLDVDPGPRGFVLVDAVELFDVEVR